MNNTSRPLGHVHPLLATILAGILSVPLLISGVYLYLSPQLPNVAQLHEIALETPLQIYSSDGKLISEFGSKHSRPLTYANIPPLFVDAFLAAEDDNFFHHSGISAKGLARAFVDILQTGSIQSGGSTITMQVAKNYFLTSQRTFSRKFTEILLARNIEQALTKQQILELYVNKIFFGQRAYGIAAAAEVYYGKTVNQLSIAEMAMIAGLPKAPSRNNPMVNPTRALERRNWILGRMFKLGYIKQDQYQAAISEPISLSYHAPTTDVYAPWLAEMVRAALVARFGDSVLGSGYKVYTTVQSDIQNAAVQSVIDGLLAYDQRHGWRGVEAHNADLSDYDPVGGLQPALVVKVGSRWLDVQLKDDSVIRLDWGALSWARPYKSVNAVGAYPNKASQLAAVGDLIRIRKTNSGWRLSQIPAVQGQLVAINPENGALQALAGGFDYQRSQFNRSIQGWRQAGSTLKPFIYTLALERGFTPDSIVNDSPLTIGNWTPSNSDGEFMGPITLRRALYLSRNLVSIRLLQAVTVERARAYLNRFGFIDKELPKNLTLALGTAQVVPIEMATGYAAFANGGYRVNPYFIERIEDSTGKLLFQAQPDRVCYDCDKAKADTTNGDTVVNVVGEGSQMVVSETDPASAIPPPPPALPVAMQTTAKRIISEKGANQMAHILRDVVVHGTARSALRLGRSDVAGKTGTTNDAKDAWFAGFNPRLVAVAWVGFDNPAPLGRIEYGGYAALPIWNDFMEYALQNIPDEGLTRGEKHVASAAAGNAPATNANTADTPADTTSEAVNNPADETGSSTTTTPAPSSNPDDLFR